MGEWLKSVLDWVNTPWRAVFLLITLPLLALLWLGYQERDLLDSILRSRFLEEPLQIDLTRSSTYAQEVLDAGADVVVAWSLDIAQNTQTIIGAWGRDRELSDLIGSTESYIVAGTDGTAAAAELSGDIPCWTFDRPYYGIDVNSVCASIIPRFASPPLGIVHGLWKADNPEGPFTQTRVRQAVGRMASGLVDHAGGR